jgi:hypothetical protein
MLYPNKKEAPMASTYSVARGLSKEEFQERLKVFQPKK